MYRIYVFLLTLNAFLISANSQDVTQLDSNMKVVDVKTKGITWHKPNSKPFRLLGFKWFEDEQIYRRLPSQNNRIPAKVDTLANHTSGGQIQFKTNSRRIIIRVDIPKYSPMYHMTHVAKCGFDIYVGPPQNQKFLGITKFKPGSTSYTSQLSYDSSGEMKNYTINFPLYSGVNLVEIGLDTNAKLERPPALSSNKPVVVYGTSITQGGCATRPGMSYTNILSRFLNVEVVNLGFSGSGKGEPEMAEVISEIHNMSLLVIDIECNTHEQLRKVLKPFIRKFRQHQQKTSILVISRIPLARDLNLSNLKKRESLKQFQHDLVQQLNNEGDLNIHFIDGTTLLNDKWGHEATVDGTHATDLGYLMMAEKLYQPILNKLN